MFKAVAVFYAKIFLTIHHASLVAKLKAVVALALTLSPLAYIVEKVSIWTLLNKDFLTGVITAIAIDHFIGSVYHGFKKKDFTFKKNLVGLLTKLGLCVFCGILFEIMNEMTRNHSFIYEYLQLVTRLIVFLYPAGSAFMNMSALTNGVFPPIGWIQKIKEFNKNLDLNKFKDDGQQQYEQNQGYQQQYNNNENQ